jgi:hypothetical protein
VGWREAGEGSSIQLEIELEPEKELEEKAKIWLTQVTEAQERFEETGDAFYAIEAFMYCHDAGVYPPLSVLDWLDGAFARYHKSNGTDDLVKLLGLKNKRGKNTYKNHKNKTLYFRHAGDIDLLVREFDCSIGDAAQMVHERAIDRGIDVPPKASTLEEYYRKGWKKHFERVRANSTIPIVRPELSSEESKKAFLESFPDTITRKIQQKRKP